MLKYENVLWKQGLIHVVGIDEVGRGALAGPVVAAAVILPPAILVDGVFDSKKLGKRAREKALANICETAIDIGVGHATPEEIAELNIIEASLLAMQRAIDLLDCLPQALLVDGNRHIPSASCPQFTLVKGDQRSQTVAAASIVAKVTRDHLMYQLHQENPDYGWATNVGYPTTKHYRALRKFGPSTHHRRSFRLR